MGWINTEDKWLSEEESLLNAQLVIGHFAQSWTRNAIAAMCGNMRIESSINPNVWEYGYGHSIERGYGLTQWTPASKYLNWATGEGFQYDDGYSQLMRIEYEILQGIQWGPLAKYNNISFLDFTRSNESVSWLTQAFIWCYERPLQSAGIESTPARIAFAERVYTELDWGQVPPDNDPRSSFFHILFSRNTNMRRRQR